MKEQYYLNNAILITLAKYLEPKKKINQNIIKDIFKAIDKMIYLYESTDNNFNLPKEYFRTLFSRFDEIRTLMVSLGYLEVTKASAKNKSAFYKFTEKFLQTRFISYPIEELEEYLRSKHLQEVINISISEIDFLSKLNIEANTAVEFNDIWTKLTTNLNLTLTNNVRKYTAICRLTKEERKLITVNNDSISEIDIVSCNFALTTTLSYNIITSDDKSKLQNYKSNDIYSIIAEYANNEYDRNEIKFNFMRYIFGSNKSNNKVAAIDKNGNKIYRSDREIAIYKLISDFFKTNTPSYHEWMYKMKKLKDTDNSIAKAYFSIERKLINNISKQLYDNNITSISIYDAIIVPTSKLEAAQRIINEELAKIDPSITTKTKLITKPEIIKENNQEVSEDMRVSKYNKTSNIIEENTNPIETTKKEEITNNRQHANKITIEPEELVEPEELIESKAQSIEVEEPLHKEKQYDNNVLFILKNKSKTFKNVKYFN